MSRSSIPLLLVTVILLAALGSVTYLGETRILSADATLGLVSAIVASGAAIGGAAGGNGNGKVHAALAAHVAEDHSRLEVPHA